MPAKKAEFIFVGDADSVIREAKRAKAATAGLAGSTAKDSKRIGGSYAAMGKAAKVAGLAIAGGLAVGAKKSVDAFAEAEQAQARMLAQLKASGVSYRAHATEIDKVIQSTSRLTALDDEDLQDAFTNIVRTTGSVSKSLKLTGLAADIARAKHMDVAKAGELVAKVAGGNTGILGRYGITIKKGASATEALAAVQAKFAGQAKAYGETSGAANERFKVAVENLEESLGRGLAPALASAADWSAKFVDGMTRGSGAGGRFVGVVRGIVQPIRDVVKGFKDGKTWAIALVGGLAGLAAGVTVIKAITVATRAWGLAMAATPLGLAVAGIAALGAGLVIAYKKSATFRKVVNGAFIAVKTVAENVFPLIGKLARNGLLGPIPLIIARWGELKKLPGRVAGFFKGLPGRMVGIGKDIVGGLISGIAAKAKDLINAIKDFVTDKIPGFVKKALGISSPSRVMHGIGLHIGQGLANGIKASAARVKGAVQSGLLFPLEGAIRAVQEQREKLQASFDAWDQRRERQGLVAAIGAARREPVGSSGSGGSRGASGAPGVSVRGRSIIGQLSNLGRSSGLSVTSTTGGKHAAGSYHYKGMAVDLAGPPAKMLAFAKQMAAKYGPKLAELFYDPLGYYVKNGKRVKGAIGGHGDHVHVAMKALLAGTQKAAVVARSARAGSSGGGIATAVDAARKAGFKGSDLVKMVAIAARESGYNPRAMNIGPRDRSFGLWQINQLAHKGRFGTDQQLKDPYRNARAAKALFDRAGFSPWMGAGGTPMSGVTPAMIARARSAVKKGGGKGVVAGGDGGSIQDAMKALRDFDRQAGRTKKLKLLDLKEADFNRLKAFKDAIGDIRSAIADRLNAAVDQFRTNWENTTGKAIDAANAQMLKSFDATTDGILRDFDRQTDAIIEQTDAAKELARLRGIDDALARQKEDADNAKALADAQYLVAHSGGKAHQEALVQLADAEAQIEATKRKREEDVLEAKVASETAAIQEKRAAERAAVEEQYALQRAALEDSLAAQRAQQLDNEAALFEATESSKLAVLTSSLEAQRLTYRDYVTKVNALLAGIGVQGFDPSADQEAVVSAGPGSKDGRPGKKSPEKNGKFDWGDGKGYVHTVPRYDWSDGKGYVHTKAATGALVRPGVIYRTGELGPEDIYVNRAGSVAVRQASESTRAGGGGDIYMTGTVNIGSHKAARVMANRLSYRLAFG